MPSQSEKERRKQIMDELAKKQGEAFEKGLPLSRDQFQELFDFLDENLDECDDTLRLTEVFMADNNIVEKEAVVTWLNEHGGYCDCEVLANVEEKFE